MNFFDVDAVLARIKKVKGLKKDREIAPLLGLSPQDFSNRKKRGTLRAPIVEWAAAEGLNVSWILTGQGEMWPKPPERGHGQACDIGWLTSEQRRLLDLWETADEISRGNALLILEQSARQSRKNEGGGSSSAGKKSG